MGTGAPHRRLPAGAKVAVPWILVGILLALLVLRRTSDAKHHQVAVQLPSPRATAPAGFKEVSNPGFKGEGEMLPDFVRVCCPDITPTCSGPRVHRQLNAQTR